MMRRLAVLLTAASMLSSLLAVSASADTDATWPPPGGSDVLFREGEVTEGLAPQATDALGLLPGIDVLRDHSLGTDVFEVWTCGAGGSAADYVAELNAQVKPWFEFHSRGKYRPEFRARGSAGEVFRDCEDHSTANASSGVNGGLHVTRSAGGFATPGFICGFQRCPESHSYPAGNGRAGFIGNERGFITTAVHEIGHMLSWPHSHSSSDNEYDNAADVMSGNYGIDGNSIGSYREPYATAAINLYAAGWVDPSEVYLTSRGDATLDLVTQAGNGVKMVVIGAGNRYYVLGPRIRSTHDPIPAAWSGVEVYEVRVCDEGNFDCARDNSMQPGYRRIRPFPAESFPWTDESAYSRPLPHIIRPDTSRTIAGVEVRVGAIDGNRISVVLDAPTFADTGNNVFLSDIEWLAESGITRGCNPPTNSRFCPDAAVTRGEMAAFLHRALPGIPAGSGTDFADDNGHVFESDIEWLAATGVTRGCNPPANTRFCPDQVVTRGQMAAFLHRALPDLGTSGSVDFADDNGHVFEGDIEWLAATGVTRGCNPPANDHFCPNDPVTRGAMAAFLHRALDG